ncbi:PREDICTED: metalloendoproteinase 2-MMP-like [Ipomoea nil]|uniref:metalloendoproteinase 2-MMP-like n=1 Tax=Ipomoea nil TaxID=35883 RepID=UPI000900871B|nr:PREDICTED: metalloendoproteinase 2-MMP-like [Ipomoea nil]
MKAYIFLGFYTLLLSFSSTLNLSSAHFFPNISSIPRTLVGNGSAGWDVFQKYLGSHTGQNVAGLSKLKNYFQRFGYINASLGSNFTDDFDDLLESAVKTYQLNFNLKPTGELDAPTIRHLVIPRCGNADIVNGSSAMNAGKFKANSTAVPAHYSFFPGRPRWPPGKTELSYAFLPENQLSDAVKGVFARAFERWSEVTPLTFTETAAFTDADIRVGFFRGDHGDGEPFDGALGTLAHAFSPPNGRLHMDGDENWVLDGDFLSSAGSVLSATDLESVAVHEIGHILGLGHSSLEGAIMYPTLPPVTRKVELADDDIQGVQDLYGSNPNPNGTLPMLTPSNQKDTSGSAIVSNAYWVHEFLLLIVLLAISLF